MVVLGVLVVGRRVVSQRALPPVGPFAGPPLVPGGIPVPTAAVVATITAAARGAGGRRQQHVVEAGQADVEPHAALDEQLVVEGVQLLRDVEAQHDGEDARHVAARATAACTDAGGATTRSGSPPPPSGSPGGQRGCTGICQSLSNFVESLSKSTACRFQVDPVICEDCCVCPATKANICIYIYFIYIYFYI